MLSKLSAISNWVQEQSQFRDAAVNQFFQGADYYLIAHALGYQCTIVTHEKSSDVKRTVPIPNVCIGVEVECMTPYKMLRLEGAKFVLGRRA